MKTLLINLGALCCAVSVFIGAIAYVAHETPAQALLPPERVVENDEEFWQDDDLLITDLMNPPLSSEASSEEPSNEALSDDELSSEEVSSTPSSVPSSKEAVSSKAPPSSTPVSSAPPSSAPPSSEPSSEEPSSEEPSSEEVSSEEQTPPPVTGDYAGILDMLAGAVQREIVGVNTPPKAAYYEAYKAQAVASHTYMEYHKALTGSYPTMSYCTPNQATVDLVAEVLNELIYDQNGRLINSVYHAASGGHTQSASYVWGNSLSYLQGVTSAYDDYSQQSVLSISEVEQKLNNYGISTFSDPSSWFDLAGATLTDGGFVQSISICGQAVSGRKLRENILGLANLKSPKIVDITISGDSFIFSTKGFGHGAGMSQDGARGYAANEGWSYKDILTHYYTGVSVY